MQEIKCPHCGKVFQVDETGYAQIVKQVRDKEFEKELHRRAEEFERDKENALKIQRMEQAQAQQASEADAAAQLAAKTREVEALQSEKERELEALRSQKDRELEALRAEMASQTQTLQAQLASFETEKKLAVAEAVRESGEKLAEKETAVATLQQQLSGKDTEMKLKEQSMQQQFAQLLKAKDEEVAFYKDFKAKQSTKMIGESLEQYCLAEFNKIRATAFPRAYFEKDNDARSGSKGDFIFRDFGGEGTEFISIMFEMKNEADTTATKHRNEDFFKELDKDRREKKCEYAVLVSMLEEENEFYNTGIADVSYRYEKMYVVRPQFFIQMITVLRNAALNALAYKQELEVVRNQQLDIRNFEDNMMAFKEGFARNYRLASEKFKMAIDEIDKTIAHLQKTKEALLSSENNLRLANNKAEDLSIKKLTKNAPSVREMFEAKSAEE